MYSKIFCPIIYHQITFTLSKGISSEYTETAFPLVPLNSTPRWTCINYISKFISVTLYIK